MEKTILGRAPCPICNIITEIRKNKNGRAYTFCGCGAEIKWPSDGLNPAKRVEGFSSTEQIKASKQPEKQPEEQPKEEDNEDGILNKLFR